MTDADARPSFVQDLIDQETRPVPAPLRVNPRRDLGTDDVPREHYVSRDYAELEARELWPRVWQMACREEEIPAIGDHVVYEVANLSYVVVRAADGLHAFVNSCLHRGTQFATTPGNTQALRCPFHGFTWSLQGELTFVPCEWDFPHLDRSQCSLPHAQIDVWCGFVFINPDLAAPSLSEYLGGLAEHFRPWPLEERYLSANVARVVECNWKVALEAFIEAWHTWTVHPQLLKTSGDSQTQYDVVEGERHWSRMITPVGIPSEHLRRDLSEQEIVNTMAMTHNDPTAIVPDGGTARELLADRVRALLADANGWGLVAVDDQRSPRWDRVLPFPELRALGRFHHPARLPIPPDRRRSGSIVAGGDAARSSARLG